ncbi:unnamed protein product, partial [Linum tenue]
PALDRRKQLEIVLRIGRQSLLHQQLSVRLFQFMQIDGLGVLLSTAYLPRFSDGSLAIASRISSSSSSLAADEVSAPLPANESISSSNNDGSPISICLHAGSGRGGFNS